MNPEHSWILSNPPMENLLNDQIADLRPSTINKVIEFQRQLNGTFEGQERQNIEEALELMCKLHADQNDRPDGTPYPEHPLEVAQEVMRALPAPDSELVIAALLHDSVEDQAAKLAAKLDEANRSADTRTQALQYIQIRFGDRVARVVSALSNPDFEEELLRRGEAVTKANKDRLYAEHVQEAIKDPDVLPIKLFDFAKNGLRLAEVADPVRKMKLTQKYAPVVGIFIDRLESGKPINLRSDVQTQLLDQLRQAYTTMQAQII